MPPIREVNIRHLFDPALEPDLFQDVLRRRAIAYLFDLFAICLLTGLAWIVVAFLGLATFGLAWLLFPALFPVIGVLYTISSLGGPTSATPGMRAMGLAMRHTDGRRPDTLTALMHVVIFYALSVTLTPLVHLVGLFTERRQLIQDLVIGVVAMDARVLYFTGR